MTDNLIAKCRLLACYHGGTDLIDRLTAAFAAQEAQRAALAEAADEIERLRTALASGPFIKEDA